MKQSQAQRRFLLIAAIAIGIALLLALIPHTHPATHNPFLFLLPVFFIGVLTVASVSARIDFMRLGYTPDAPARPAAFQRPPPNRTA